MTKDRVRFYIGITVLLLGIFALIFLILLYSLAIIDMASDGLMRPFVFLAILVSVVFTVIFAINRFLIKRERPAENSHSK